MGRRGEESQSRRRLTVRSRAEHAIPRLLTKRGKRGWRALQQLPLRLRRRKHAQPVASRGCKIAGVERDDDARLSRERGGDEGQIASTEPRRGRVFRGPRQRLRAQCNTTLGGSNPHACCAGVDIRAMHAIFPPSSPNVCRTSLPRHVGPPQVPTCGLFCVRLPW